MRLKELETSTSITKDVQDKLDTANQRLSNINSLFCDDHVERVRKRKRIAPETSIPAATDACEVFVKHFYDLMLVYEGTRR